VVLGECKDYGLKNQMTKAGVSVASNIAEGAERGSAAEFIRFIHIAKGSAAELRARAKITSHFYISASAHLWLIPHSQNPRNSSLFLWF